MGWKPKDKDLTIEAAVAMAKKELAPFWAGASPQIAGIKTGAGYSVFPLDPQFEKSPWLVIVVDPTEFSGESGVQFAEEWHRRYNSLDLKVLVVFAAPYAFIRTPEFIQRWLEDRRIDFTIAVDVENALVPAFEVGEMPSVLLQVKSQKRFQYAGWDSLDQVEPELQTFLRLDDPGLPLLPVFDPSKRHGKDVLRIDLGEQERNQKQIVLGGQWKQEEERISTSDPQATITLNCPSPRLSIVAQSLSKTIEIPTISFEPGGNPAYERIAGEHLVMDDDGLSAVRVRHPMLYHSLVNLPETERQVTLRFTNSNLAPVAVYGIRFGD